MSATSWMVGRFSTLFTSHRFNIPALLYHAGGRKVKPVSPPCPPHGPVVFCCNGHKTGFTKKAKRTLVTASKKDEKTCIVVTLNDGNDFNDHKNLCENVFNNYDRVAVLDKDSLVIDAENPQKYYIKNDFYALLTEEEKKEIRIDFQIDSESQNEEVGIATVYLKEEPIHEEKIYQNLEEEPKKENFFQKFLRWLFKW